MFYKSQLTYRGSRSLKYASILAMIIFIISACNDGVIDSNYNSSNSIANIESMADTSEIYSMEISQSACINPVDPEYSEKTESKTIEWGNPGKPFTKTVDIVYFNTLDQFVLKVKSSHSIADVFVDDESIKNFNGTVSPDTWQEFTFELEQDWGAGDTWTFEVKVAGFGPLVYFDIDYALIGECAGWLIDNYTEVVDVVSATGRVWMDRNLGASRAATSSTDAQAYGDIYQWGRAADGHQHRNSLTTTTLSSSDQPSHGVYIVTPNEPGDWRNPQNNDLWQGVIGTNNPCPSGYRLPTDTEWEAELNSWSSYDDVGAFASPLRLPLAGHRFFANGAVSSVGDGGDYWSSTVSGTDAQYMFFFSGVAGVHKSERAYGHSVRCIKH